jgi:uncharacterized protein YndB with AHSA1/START domain
MHDATLSTAGGRPVLRFERRLPHPPEVVWRALIDPVELRTWFPGDIVADEWTEGSALTFRQEGHPDTAGVVLEVEEPRRLSYSWWGNVLRFELTALAGGGTLLVLTDELDGDSAARNAAGWEVCLGRLLGGGDPDLEWQPRFEHYVAEFEPTLGTQAGPPPATKTPAEMAPVAR